MPVSKRQALHGYNKVVRTEQYDNIMHSTHLLATSSLAIAMYKSPEEKKQLFESVDNLFRKLWDGIAKEPPVVVSLALLTAIQTTVELMKEEAEKHTQEINKWR